MKTIMKFWKLGLLSAFVLIGAASCGDDKKKGNDGDGDSDPPGWQCDPAGANPAMGALLNAPVANDVEVVVKTAKHPGDPGPLNLP